MMTEELKAEIISLLDGAKAYLLAGDVNSASKNIKTAKDKIDPIGGGSLGPIKS